MFHDFKELLSVFNAQKVKYLIAGEQYGHLRSPSAPKAPAAWGSILAGEYKIPFRPFRRRGGRSVLRHTDR